MYVVMFFCFHCALWLQHRLTHGAITAPGFDDAISASPLTFQPNVQQFWSKVIFLLKKLGKTNKCFTKQMLFDNEISAKKDTFSDFRHY